jgi:hypothetical protein
MASKSNLTFLDSGPIPVKFALCYSRKDFSDEMKRRGAEGFEFGPHLGEAFRFDMDNGGLFVIIALDRQSLLQEKISIQMNVCTHEAVHAYQYMRDFVGEEAPGMEMEAYTIAWLAEHAFRGLRGETE